MIATLNAPTGIGISFDGSKDAADDMVALNPSKIAIQYYDAHINGIAGYQVIDTITGLAYDTLTGLAPYTSYNIKVAVSGETAEELTLGLSTDTTWGALIAAFNATFTDCVLSIVGGVPRVTALTRNSASAISLSTPAGASKCFESLTGFTGYHAAVQGDDGDEGVETILVVETPSGYRTVALDHYIFFLDDTYSPQDVIPKAIFEAEYTLASS